MYERGVTWQIEDLSKTNRDSKGLILDHHIYTKSSWEEVMSFEHLRLLIKSSVDTNAYRSFHNNPPKNCYDLLNDIDFDQLIPNNKQKKKPKQ